MNKAQLLDYYSSHYTSRQEIMFKLPFSINADEFWQELLNRRKMNAVVLPLHNAIGKPYWYVMTDKMIKASELLCDEAMNQNGFDPFHSEMTSAMTLEMFFTSYVEGVQLNMQEALEYLSQDIEPSDVNEQVLYNNRQALTTMTGMLYYPIDERLTKHLSYLLTQELDGCSMEYRILGNADISLMDAGKFILPSPNIIPERMNELYSFLAQNNVHPLVKSAAAQAFILTTRPFTEGNERLARIISSMILYRSGYDYFRDISISQKIASENYRYYAVMQEILQLENDGDITCFMEYFIDLLARALIDSQREKQRRIEEKSVQHDQMLEQEKQMSHFPLVPQELEEAPAAEIRENEEFWNEVQKYSNSKSAINRKVGEFIIKIINDGTSSFTPFELSEFLELEIDKTRKICFNLKKCGIIKNISKQLHKANYCVTILTQSQESPQQILDKIKNKILHACSNDGYKESILADALIRLLDSGKMSFNKSVFSEKLGLGDRSVTSYIRLALDMNLIYKSNSVPVQFTFITDDIDCPDFGNELSDRQKSILKALRRCCKGEFTISEAYTAIGVTKNVFSYNLKPLITHGYLIYVENTYPHRYTLNKEKELADSSDNNDDTVPNIYDLTGSENSRDQRLLSTLEYLINSSKLSFTRSEWSEITGLSSSTSKTDIKQLLYMGLITVTVNSRKFTYHIQQASLNKSHIPIQCDMSDPVSEDSYERTEYSAEPVMAGACV